MMFEGKEKRLDLIAELRATEEWKAAWRHLDLLLRFIGV
jgi:hypothetical protein